MKRICFFSGDITRSGGTERAAVLVAQRLAEEFDVIFLSIMEQNKTTFFPVPESIPRHVLTTAKKWKKPGPEYLPLIPRLRRFLKNWKVDIIVDIDRILDLLTVPAAAGLPVKLVAWEHFNYDYQWPSLPYRIFRKAAAAFTVRYADHIVTLTERDRENYCTRLGRQTGVSVIHNPVEFPWEPEDQKAREKILITVGRLTRVKGTDLLAELAPKLLDRHRDWKWYVLGEGEDRKLLETAVTRHHLEGRLILTGNVQDVKAYLKKASLYVMTSRAEGLPMCLLESVGCGVPCVSFDIATGPGEIIMDGKNGFLIPPFDMQQMTEKLSLLMENHTLRREFQKNTAKSREKFRLEPVILQWKKLLNTL